MPVRVKKTRQNKEIEPPFRFNRNGKALDRICPVSVPFSRIAGSATTPLRPAVTAFRARQISFSVLTVLGIFTEMDACTFPDPSVDDQIRTRSAHRRAQPASLPAGCREYCERDPR